MCLNFATLNALSQGSRHLWNLKTGVFNHRYQKADLDFQFQRSIKVVDLSQYNNNFCVFIEHTSLV